MRHRISADVNFKKIDVVILSGGQGTRLRKVIKNYPKSMAIMAGRPFLDILIDYVSGYGFRRFILCTGYMSDVIKKHYVNKRESLEILFSDEDKPLGTGGAVKNAETIIQSSSFLVMNGDSFCSANLSQFFEFHLTRRAQVSMVVVGAKDCSDFGVLALDDSQRIIRFKEKRFQEKWGKEKSFINAGIYIFDKKILSLIPACTKYSLECDLFPDLVDKEFYGYITREKLIDIGTPERYEQARRFFL